MNIFKKVTEKVKYSINPVDYCRKKGTTIGEGCELRGDYPFGSEPYLIALGNHVRVNSGVQFVTHDGSVWVLRGLAGKNEKYPEELKKSDIFGSITVGNNVQINTNVMILPGVTIGDNVIIGAGAIVTRDIPDNSVAVGIPARVIETIDEYLAKHKKLDDITYTKGMSPKCIKELLRK